MGEMSSRGVFPLPLMSKGERKLEKHIDRGSYDSVLPSMTKGEIVGILSLMSK